MQGYYVIKSTAEIYKIIYLIFALNFTGLLLKLSGYLIIILHYRDHSMKAKFLTFIILTVFVSGAFFTAILRKKGRDNYNNSGYEQNAAAANYHTTADSDTDAAAGSEEGFS